MFSAWSARTGYLKGAVRFRRRTGAGREPTRQVSRPRQSPFSPKGMVLKKDERPQRRFMYKFLPLIGAMGIFTGTSVLVAQETARPWIRSNFHRNNAPNWC